MTYNHLVALRSLRHGRAGDLHHALVLLWIALGLDHVPHLVNLEVLAVDDLKQNDMHVAERIFLV